MNGYIGRALHNIDINKLIQGNHIWQGLFSGILLFLCLRCFTIAVFAVAVFGVFAVFAVFAVFEVAVVAVAVSDSEC